LDIAIFGPLKKRLTANLSHLNQAQLARIQKAEWLDAYIQARLDVCTPQNIASAWRGAGLFPFNRQRALRRITQEGQSLEQEPPKTSTQFDIFDQVFINSSPPDETTLRSANQLLNSTLDSRIAPSTPVRQYIRKLALGTEQLRARSIVYQHDATNLRSILQKRKIRTNGKRIALKGHFLVSTQELCNAVVVAEKATKERASKKRKTKGKKKAEESKTEEDIEEETGDNSESEIEDYIIVDVE
jgi:uncharacterized protein (DUF2267 family)